MKKELNFDVKKFNEEIYDSFASYIDVENEEIKKLQKELEKLKQLNKELKAENTKLKKEIARMKENPKNKKYTVAQIREKIEKDYDFLYPESRAALISGEHKYLNEHEDVDFSGAYIDYTKVLEIEIKRRVKFEKKVTFGKIVDLLESTSVFPGLVNELNKNKVTLNRNRGAHRGVIKKSECGKIRKILLQDGWLLRVIEYFEEIPELEDEDLYMDEYSEYEDLL